MDDEQEAIKSTRNGDLWHLTMKGPEGVTGVYPMCLKEKGKNSLRCSLKSSKCPAKALLIGGVAIPNGDTAHNHEPKAHDKKVSMRSKRWQRRGKLSCIVLDTSDEKQHESEDHASPKSARERGRKAGARNTRGGRSCPCRHRESKANDLQGQRIA